VRYSFDAICALSDKKLLRQLATCKIASSMHDSRAFQHKYFQMVEEKKMIILFFFRFFTFFVERHMRAKIKFFQHFFCSPTPERDGGFLSGTLLWSPIESTLYRFTVAAPALSRRPTQSDRPNRVNRWAATGRLPRPSSQTFRRHFCAAIRSSCGCRSAPTTSDRRRSDRSLTRTVRGEGAEG